MKTFTTFILSICACIVVAQSNKSKDIIADKGYKKAVQAAEKYIDSLRINQHLPGVSICVGNKDKILWAEGFGMADLENNVPVTINSLWRVGSISKTLTAYAIGRLYEQGRLDLDAPVRNYLPDFPEKKYPFTTRQLAAHTAGIRHYGKNDPYAIPKRYKTVKESLSIFSNDSLLFKPGTASNYSTYGFNLISAVLEVASGKDFPSYMVDSIFLPLGMKGTLPDYSDSIVPNRVRFYENDKSGKTTNAMMVDNSYKWAGGGFLSKPTDLVTMVQGLLNHRLVNEQTVNLMFTPQKLANDSSTYVGIAWRINQNKQGVTFIHHGGVIDGGRTFVFFYPQSGYIFAVTANISTARLNVNEAATILQYFISNQ